MIMSTVNILSYAEIPSTDEDIPRELSVGQLLERANRNYSKLVTCFKITCTYLLQQHWWYRSGDVSNVDLT